MARLGQYSQSVSLVLTKLRMRYKGDHKCRRAANTGLTLLPLYLTVLHITRTFLSTSWGCAWSDIYIQLFNFYSCAYPGSWVGMAQLIMDVQVLNRSVNPAFLCCCLVAGVLALLCCLDYFGINHPELQWLTNVPRYPSAC